MSLEARIERGGRQVLTSPLWVGLLITAFLVLPVFLVPGIPLWIGILSLLSLLPIVLGSTYLSAYIYDHVVGDSTDAESTDAESIDGDEPTAIDRLRHAYATGEIDEETFERRLERLLETEDVDIQRHGRSDGANPETDLITE